MDTRTSTVEPRPVVHIAGQPATSKGPIPAAFTTALPAAHMHVATAAKARELAARGFLAPDAGARIARSAVHLAALAITDGLEPPVRCAVDETGTELRLTAMYSWSAAAAACGPVDAADERTLFGQLAAVLRDLRTAMADGPDDLPPAA